MTLAHFVYIPGVLLLGLIVGYILGGRAVEAARANRAHDAQRKAARKARERGNDGPNPQDHRDA